MNETINNSIIEQSRVQNAKVNTKVKKNTFFKPVSNFFKNICCCCSRKDPEFITYITKNIEFKPEILEFEPIEYKPEILEIKPIEFELIEYKPKNLEILEIKPTEFEENKSTKFEEILKSMELEDKKYKIDDSYFKKIEDENLQEYKNNTLQYKNNTLHFAINSTQFSTKPLQVIFSFKEENFDKDNN